MTAEKRITGKDAARTERERRLAKALRDNLRRRKAGERQIAADLPPVKPASGPVRGRP